MKLIHTSPVEIKEITQSGLFDDCLFFSVDQYEMSKAEVVYTIEIDESKMIEVSGLFDDTIIEHISTALDLTKEQAEALLDGSEVAGDFTGDYEDGWFIQAMQGKTAKLMGYEAAIDNDEQGTCYIVPMFCRENDLVRVK